MTEMTTGISMLSPNFSLQELCHSDTAQACGIDNTPDTAAIEQLTLLANITLEGIRSLCGDHPVQISSGFRCEDLNEEVGGVPDSAHRYGAAADFTIPAFGTVDEICQVLTPYLDLLEIDQLINETGGGATWVHVGRAVPPALPRHEVLIIF
jgi:hypothetical protein